MTTRPWDVDIDTTKAALARAMCDRCGERKPVETITGSGTSFYVCADCKGSRRIPPGHVGIVDPLPVAAHEERLCLKHAPQVEVTWIVGDGCPLCASYENERALLSVAERAVCQHAGECSPVDTHNGCNARAVLHRLYGGWLPSVRADRQLGDTGLRDPEFPCEDYEPGEKRPAADCETDGHYLCPGCRHAKEQEA